MLRSLFTLAAGCALALSSGSETPGEEDFVGVTVPPGWHIGEEQLLPRMAPPAAILALGTFPPRLDPSRACSRSPDFPQLGVGRREALVMVDEQRRGYPWLARERPRTFRLKRSVFPWECLARSGFLGVHETFGDAGRLLTVTAIVGPDAPRRARRETLAVLQSLRFARREHGIEARPVSGRPSGAFRVRMVSGTWTGERGRMRTVYSARVRGPKRPGCVSAHHAEFPFARTGTRVEAVLRPEAARGGRWCRGRYRGLIRLHRVLAGDPVRPERVGRFEFRVR